MTHRLMTLLAIIRCSESKKLRSRMRNDNVNDRVTDVPGWFIEEVDRHVRLACMMVSANGSA